jgi:hypothetical protein
VDEAEYLAGVGRLRAKIASADIRTVEVLQCHLAIERELDGALYSMLERPEKLGKISYEQKVRLLSALYPNDRFDFAEGILIAFNHLRNEVAHGDRRTIEGAFRKLCKTFSLVGDLDPKHTTVTGIATSMIGLMCGLLDEEGHSLGLDR